MPSTKTFIVLYNFSTLIVAWERLSEKLAKHQISVVSYDHQFAAIQAKIIKLHKELANAVMECWAKKGIENYNTVRLVDYAK